MTTGDHIDDDAKKLAEISAELPPLDVDATTAAQIARRARADVGKGSSKRRWILPLVAALVSVSYAVWAIGNALDIFG